MNYLKKKNQQQQKPRQITSTIKHKIINFMNICYVKNLHMEVEKIVIIITVFCIP